MMPEKRVLLLGQEEYTEKYVCQLMGKKPEELSYKITIDSNAPEYLIANESIYYNRDDNKKFRDLCKYAKVRIFDCGECIDPDLNMFDYAITRNRDLRCGDRVITHKYDDRIQYKNDIADITTAKKRLSEKKYFCNFIYSNPRGHIRRKELFEGINSYKEVDSLGQWLNNKVPNNTRYETQADMLNDSIVMKIPYKFSIACENATYNGYISEKLINSFRAHTIPIYWGSPTVAEEFNPKAFINCHDFETIEDVICRIQEIDKDDELWCQMIMEPWLTRDQEERTRQHINEFHSFICNIFDQSVELAVRRGIGFHPDNYDKWFFERIPMDWKKLPRKLKAMMLDDRRL